MTQNHRFDGVIFDMDGVLCDSEPFIRRAAMQMFAQTHGQTVKEQDFHPFTGAGEDRFIGGVAELYGVDLIMPRDKQRTYELYLELIRDNLEPLPGAVAFIQRLREMGLKTAVATSADRVKLEGNLRELGLPAAGFDAVVTGSDVEHKKPAPDIFLAAARGLGLAPARCLVVEDAPSGVQAAVTAGSPCLGLTTTFAAEQLADCGAQWCAPDLARVPEGVLG